MNRFCQRLNLEALEDRRLLSTCNVVRLGDFGAGGTMGDFSRGDLRFCINKANENPGPDTIKIQVTGTINLTGPLPDLASDMDIVGPGSGLLTIRRDTGGDYRLITVGGGSATISGVTFSNGRADVGGGIYNQGSLTLNEVAVTSNTSTAGQGGGIYNAGALLVNGGTTSTNLAQSAAEGSGGGIYNTEFGVITINSSFIVDNEASGTATLRRGFGGGIYNHGSLLLSQSAVIQNRARGNCSGGTCGDLAAGGGVYNSSSGVFTAEFSTLLENGVNGPSIVGGSGSTYGGGILNLGTADIGNCLIQDNFTGFAQAMGQSFGGGIHNAGTMSVANSTMYGNSIGANGGSALGQGGGINNFGTLTIAFNTIASNRIWNPSGGHSTKLGGGVANTGTLNMQNTIVANNTFSLGGPTSGKDFYGVLTSSGYNLFSASEGGSGYASTDILEVDPLLGPLQDNGGPTQTMALLPGSPAIDAGDPNPVDPPEWDQRGPGFPRIVNGRLDIGAFEVQATGLPPTQGLAALITADFETTKAKRRK